MTRKGYKNTFRPKREDEKVPQTRQMMKRPRKGGREFVCRAIALRQSRSIIERGTEFHRDCLPMKKKSNIQDMSGKKVNHAAKIVDYKKETKSLPRVICR